MELSAENTSHTVIAAQLRGQKIHIPSITNLFSTWPQGRKNHYYERLQLVMNQQFDRVISEENRREQFKKSDFALFCAFWYPDADWDRIYLCTIFTAWAFLWDDTIDTNEHALSADFERACLFRKQSLEYVKYWLNVQDDETISEDTIITEQSYQKRLYHFIQEYLPSFVASTGCDSQQEEGPTAPSLGCGTFKEFGQKVCHLLNTEQRTRFYEQVEMFAKCTEIEQAERLADKMPSREHYMKVRLGTTADFIYCCLEEVAVNTALPQHIMDSATMRKCWEECNICIIIINDILSLKKELLTDCVVNLVPVLCCEGKSLQNVIHDLMIDLQESRDRFDQCASELEALVIEDKPLASDLSKYLNGLRTNVTGTVDYSMKSKRYGIAKYLGKDGTLDIIL